MCIFSGRSHTLVVSGTRIFGRRDGSRQALAYEMTLRAREEVAMVLPLPARGAEDAVTFVDLSDYPTLFDDLALAVGDEGWALAVPQPAKRAAPLQLVVHEVGAFVASFVPSIAEFHRLDPRFRLDDSIWRALPGYHDWGFAVFQLQRGDRRVHPIALWLEARDPGRLFFPTVHVHDGFVHPRADFDHELYWQGPPAPGAQTSQGPLDALGVKRAQGLLVAERVHRRTIRGAHPNADVWI